MSEHLRKEDGIFRDIYVSKIIDSTPDPDESPHLFINMTGNSG